MTESQIALIFSGLMLIVVVIEKIFGGGNGLANRFAKLDKDTSERIAALEKSMSARIDSYEDNVTVGIDAIKANIHAMQLATLEFRAKMAEEYIRHGGLDEVKRDMREGFVKVEERLGQLQDMIVWAQPAQAHAPTKPGR